MNRSLSILTKIWLSLSILIVSYFVSMIFGFFFGQKIEERLLSISELIVPAANLSNQALNTYKEQIQLYEEAVMSGEKIFLESAKSKSSKAQNSLLFISQLNGLDQDLVRFINETRDYLQAFTFSAQITYASMCSVFNEVIESETTIENAEKKMKTKAVLLNQQTKELTDRLTHLSKLFTQRLNKEMTDICHINKQIRYLNLVVFFSVVLFSLTLVSIIVSKSISRPLKKTLMLENAVEQSVDGIAVIDLHGYILFCNIAWAKMHGYKRDDLMGEHISCLHSEAQFYNEVLPSITVVKKGGTFEGEIGRRRRDGAVFPSMMTLNIIQDVNMETSIVSIARDITKQKYYEAELTRAKENAEEANKNIMDSLRYATMIQSSLLPNFDKLKRFLPESFFIWKPRELVGGDMIYMDIFMNGIIIAVIDCTGHGVPGAFMTMIAYSGLRKIIKDDGCYDPSQILKHLNIFVKTTLQQDKPYALTNDGLDAAICYIPLMGDRFTDPLVMTFAGAKMPLLYISNNELLMIKGDKQSIGYKDSDTYFEFTNHILKINGDMCFYMLTDGFTDQLGGEHRRRFSNKRLKNLLSTIWQKPLKVQKDVLLKDISEYQGQNEQQDDITIIGFRITS
ncbi:MAG: PAS domain S-box protein [Desulfobacterales bacterium]|nr:PAS domain S-box protein [Desulfobacterales bacterium]